MLYNQKVTVLFLIISLVLLFSSGAAAQENDEIEFIRVTGIRLEDDKTEMTLVLGESEELSAIVYPLYATDRRVTWSNSDPEVVELDVNGHTAEIKSRSIGEATITVSTVDRGFWIESQVKVIRLVESIGIEPRTLTLAPGETAELEAWVLPRDAEEQGIKWESADSDIVTVDEKGKVTARNEGEGRIIASSIEDQGIRILCTVTVREETEPPIEANDVDDEFVDEIAEDEEDNRIMLVLFGSGGGIALVGALLFAMRTRKKRQSFQAGPSAVPGSSLGQPVLVGLSGLYAGQKTDLSQGLVTIGRDPQTAQVLYPQENDQISRKHCTIYFDRNEQQFIIEDSSTNGTFLADGQRLKQYQKYPLQPGDIFTLAESGESFRVGLE